MYSCKKNTENKSNSDFSTKVNILLTDANENEISKTKLAKSTEVFNDDKVYSCKEDASELVRSFYAQVIDYKDVVKNEKTILKI